MSLLGSVARRVGKLHPGLDARFSWMAYRRHQVSLRVIDRAVKRGAHVIDVGAADGLYAARFSQLVGRSGHVHAFEPNPAQFERLQAATAGRANVMAYAMGLSDHSGQAELHIPVLEHDQRPGLGQISVPADRMTIDHRVVSVTLETLDSVFGAEPPPVSFLKIDVEGHEPAVLRGAQGLLERRMPIILVEIEQRHQDTPVQATFDYLQEFGYAGYSLTDEAIQPLADFDVERDQLAYVSEDFEEILPAGYVNDFLFVPPWADSGWLARYAA